MTNEIIKYKSSAEEGSFPLVKSGAVKKCRPKHILLAVMPLKIVH